MQNIPAKLIKSLLRSEDGWTLVTADYSSVESRILAYAANDKNYIDSVNSRDAHKVNAMKMFHLDNIEDVTSEQRTKAKVLCLKNDTQIVTSVGLISIENLHERFVSGEKLSVKSEDGSWNRVSHSFDTGKNATVTLSTATGAITGTPHHPLRVVESDGKIQYKALSRISKGDVVVRSWKPYVEFKPGFSYKFYLLGILTSEGHKSKTCDNYSIDMTDSKIAGMIRECLQHLNFKYSEKYIERSGKLSYWHFNILKKSNLSSEWEDFGTSWTKEIPSILKVSEDYVSIISYLSGLWDGDGYFGKSCGYTTVSDRLFSQVSNLLIKLGIQHVPYIHPKRSHVKEIRVTSWGASRLRLVGVKCFNTESNQTGGIFWNLQSYISSLGKHRKLQNIYLKKKEPSRKSIVFCADSIKDSYCQYILDNDLSFEKVSSIENSEAHTYDITVENTHNFIANGFSSSNTFAVPYGASALGMWQKGLGDTLEEAEELINDFFTAFPQVKKYLDAQVVDALTRGYTQDRYGRIRWYEIPKRNEATVDEISSSEKAAKRQAQNFGIQALSASVTKMAIKNLYKLFRKVNWGRMLLTIHDSVFFEIRSDMVAEAIPIIKKIMEDAATEIMDTLVAPVDFEIGKYRELTDKLSGTKFYAYEYELEEGKLVWNEPLLSEETEKKLKGLGIPQTDDLQGMYQQVLERLELQTPEWHAENKKWVNSFRSLAR